jgi:hypothetical protein
MKFAEQALERLVKVIGPEKTAALRKEALAATGIDALDSPQDVLVFASYLVRRGGVIEAIGHAMKVQAMLRGAVEDDEAPPLSRAGSADPFSEIAPRSVRDSRAI